MGLGQKNSNLLLLFELSYGKVVNLSREKHSGRDKLNYYHIFWQEEGSYLFPSLYEDIGNLLLYIYWGLSSAGRAPALHAGGQRFDPARLHQYNVMAV